MASTTLELSVCESCKGHRFSVRECRLADETRHFCSKCRKDTGAKLTVTAIADVVNESFGENAPNISSTVLLGLCIKVANDEPPQEIRALTPEQLAIESVEFVAARHRPAAIVRGSAIHAEDALFAGTDFAEPEICS